MFLAAIEDAAVPVTMLSADVLAQEQKQLPITDEFFLRFVSVGVDSPTEVSSLLGIDLSRTLDSAAAQVSEYRLKRVSGGRLSLTAQGTEFVRDLVATHPVERPLPVAFDRLTWRVAPYSDYSLVEKRSAEDAGFAILPAARSQSITKADIPAASLNALLSEDRVEVLRILGVQTRKHRYLPVKMLVYKSLVDDELELDVVIDDQLSSAHAAELARLKVAEALHIKVEEPAARPELDAELEEMRNRSAGEVPGVPDPSNNESEPVTTSEVRSVSVFEHADLLDEALRSSERRLLIISPWVRGAVVNRDFVSLLEGRLRKGVKVTIAHGYGDDDRGSDDRALRLLENLAKRYSSFDLVRLNNTHAKILIFDDNWISTSFNWLSFRGDPDRTYRMEEGTLVTVSHRVQSEYRRYLDLIETERR